VTAVARRVDPGYDLVDGEEALLQLATDAVARSHSAASGSSTSRRAFSTA
jgi:hypothetical protein